jgi:hypothetical protein
MKPNGRLIWQGGHFQHVTIAMLIVNLIMSRINSSYWICNQQYAWHSILHLSRRRPDVVSRSWICCHFRVCDCSKRLLRVSNISSLSIIVIVRLKMIVLQRPKTCAFPDKPTNAFHSSLIPRVSRKNHGIYVILCIRMNMRMFMCKERYLRRLRVRFSRLGRYITRLTICVVQSK